MEENRFSQGEYLFSRRQECVGSSNMKEAIQLWLKLETLESVSPRLLVHS